MTIKKLVIIVVVIILVTITILLYHDFVSVIPESDLDNFNYINTPQSFKENIKVLIKNGYTIITMEELNDANNGKSKLPEKPILITLDDGYYSNYQYIYIRY